MRFAIALVLTLITPLPLLAAPAEIGVEHPSEEIMAGLRDGSSLKGGIFIWDGSAPLTLLVQVTDKVSGKPISGATVSVVRDRRVKRGPSGRAYGKPGPVRTNSGGRATIRASFPAAGTASGFSVFICDSYVTVQAFGHAPARARISLLDRLDFAPRTKDCKVPLRLALKRT
jgi:hypothetical protein